MCIVIVIIIHLPTSYPVQGHVECGSIWHNPAEHHACYISPSQYVHSQAQFGGVSTLRWVS